MSVLLLQSCLFVTPWTVAHQTPLSMGLSRQEYWSGWPCPPPGDLTDPGIKLASLMSPALAGMSLPLVPPGTLSIRNTKRYKKKIKNLFSHADSKFWKMHIIFL